MENIIITSEMLQTIYKRSIQYFRVKHNFDPDSIEIQSDGEIVARWDDRGDSDSEYFYCEELNKDLETLYAEEEERKRIELEKKAIRDAENKRAWEQKEKEKRKELYKKLHKEFGDTEK